MAELSQDEFFINRALELAKRAWGDTHPNPMVGAVIVKNGKIIAEGWHKKDGGAHAEINAINALKEPAQGAEIYVTLEPCSTKGRTGACCDAIIKNKFSRVIIGALDPNPAHSGRALEVFKNANIKCTSGVLAENCRRLNFIFNYAITQNSALLAIKFAQTSNGKIAQTLGKPSRITEDAARRHLMLYRKLFPAIAVGFKTLVSDNPSLTCRSENSATCNTRLLLDRSLSCAALNLENFKLFSDEFRDKTFVICDLDSPQSALETLAKKGVQVIRLNTKRCDESSFWKALKLRLFEMRLPALMVEGGAQILSSIANTNSADFMFEYTSNKVFPQSAPDVFNTKKPEFESFTSVNLSPDICKMGFVKKS